MGSRCATCGRVVPEKPRCLYCGGPVIHDSVTDAADRQRRFDAAKAKANAFVDESRFAEAAAALDEAIALEPREATLFVARGLCLGNLGQRAQAIESLDRALALDDMLVDAWFHKADYLETLNRLDESLRCYDAALERDPRHFQAACDRGHVLNRLGRPADALRSFELAISLSPNAPIAWFNKAGAELATRDYDASAKSFAHFLTIADPAMFGPAIAQARELLAKLQRQ